MPSQVIFLQNYNLKDGRSFTAGETCSIASTGSVTQDVMNLDNSSRGPQTIYELTGDGRTPLFFIPNDMELTCWQFVGEFVWFPGRQPKSPLIPRPCDCEMTGTAIVVQG